MLGYLRDIRVSGFKRMANEKNANSEQENREAAELAEEALQTRERAGYERGRQEAEQHHARQLEEARRKWEQEHREHVLHLLETVNKRVNQQAGEMFKALEKHLIMLAAEAAIKLTSGIPISTDMVEAHVRDALGLVERETEVTVVLNPEDLSLLEQHQSTLLNQSGSSPVMRFRADPKLSRGGCLLETRFGELDARRETKIELLKKAVNE